MASYASANTWGALGFGLGNIGALLERDAERKKREERERMMDERYEATQGRLTARDELEQLRYAHERGGGRGPAPRERVGVVAPPSAAISPRMPSTGPTSRYDEFSEITPDLSMAVPSAASSNRPVGQLLMPEGGAPGLEGGRPAAGFVESGDVHYRTKESLAQRQLDRAEEARQEHEDRMAELGEAAGLNPATARYRAAGGTLPNTRTPRNIDPLSDLGIAQARERAEAMGVSVMRFDTALELINQKYSTRDNDGFTVYSKSPDERTEMALELARTGEFPAPTPEPLPVAEPIFARPPPGYTPPATAEPDSLPAPGPTPTPAVADTTTIPGVPEVAPDKAIFDEMKKEEVTQAEYDAAVLKFGKTVADRNFVVR